MIDPNWKYLRPVDRFCAIATHYAGVSADTRVDDYLELMARPGDPKDFAHRYYVGPPAPSTCALTSLGIYRLAGLPWPKWEHQYEFGSAVAELTQIGENYRALTRWPDLEVKRGSVFLIDSSGYNSHLVNVVSEPTTNHDGSITIDTVEGGQGNGGVIAATRHLIRRGTHLYMGERYLWWTIDPERLPLPEAEQREEERQAVEAQKLAYLAGSIVQAVEEDEAESPGDRVPPQE